MAIRKNLRGVFGLDTALYVLLLLAAGFSIWSAHRYSQLQETFAKTTYDLSHARVGDWLPRMEFPILQDPDSTAKIAAPEKKGQVLYFFSPACEYCRASQQHVEQLYEVLLEQGDMEMYAVSMVREDLTRTYLAETGSRIPTVVLPGKREFNLMRINGVPTLLTLDGEGRITYAHYGVIESMDAPTTRPSEDRSPEDLPGDNNQ